VARAEFHNYADYALGDEFASAFAELTKARSVTGIDVLRGGTVAVPSPDHHRLPAADGNPVDHLMAVEHTDHATPTSGAQRTASGKIIYPDVEGSHE
jgi:hypothetical protein